MKLLNTLLLILLVLSCSTKYSDKKSANTLSEKAPVHDSIKEYLLHDEPLIALVNTTLVDGIGNDIGANQTIIIRDGIFEFVGHADQIDIPDDAKILNLKGKTVIPGIVGVHNHLHIPGYPDIAEVASKLYLASGVTTIQTCGSAAPFREIQVSNAIENHELVGPEIINSAPYITGPGGSRAMIIPRDHRHIRDTMRFWLDRGVSWFKVYRDIRPDDLKVVVSEAHKNKAKVTGHFCSITFAEAVEMGVDGIEHGFNSAADFRTNKDYGQCNGGRSYMDELEISSDEVQQLHQLMIDNDVFLNSTLSIYETSVSERAYADDRTLRVMSPSLVEEYRERRGSMDKTTSKIDRLSRLKKIMSFEYQFFQMGGLLGAGVDAGRHNLPGFGDQRNYELFIEAGFTTEEAIQVMTSNGAKILERNDIGSVQKGKRADIVILVGDLGRDSSVIRNVECVFKGGLGYDPEAILKELDGQVGIELSSNIHE